MGKAMIISVGTGKDGKDIAHGICFSIQHHNPDFIVFLVTAKSRETTMPFVRENGNVNQRKIEEIILNDSDDVEKITLDCQEIIRKIKNNEVRQSDIVVDYTSGTKAMSAGLTIAAIREKIGILSYTTGKRGEGGRVISGTERVLSLIPNQIFAWDLFKEAIHSFNSYHFDVTKKILEEAKVLLPEPDFIQKVSLLESLSTAYEFWDKFDIKNSFEILKNLKKEQTLKEWHIERQVELNKQALYQEKENLFCPERLFDLLENAKRRGEDEHKYDDAVARLYRVCEYLGQYEIWKEGLYKVKDGKPDTSDLDILKLPESLREKYLKFKASVDGKVKVDLSGNYELLYDLNHPLGHFYKRKIEQFKELMGLRNLSILAHGFNPLSEGTYKKMQSLVEELIVANGLDPKTMGKVKFPKIKLE